MTYYGVAMDPEAAHRILMRILAQHAKHNANICIMVDGSIRQASRDLEQFAVFEAAINLETNSIKILWIKEERIGNEQLEMQYEEITRRNRARGGTF